MPSNHAPLRLRRTVQPTRGDTWETITRAASAATAQIAAVYADELHAARLAAVAAGHARITVGSTTTVIPLSAERQAGLRDLVIEAFAGDEADKRTANALERALRVSGQYQAALARLPSDLEEWLLFASLLSLYQRAGLERLAKRDPAYVERPSYPRAVASALERWTCTRPIPR